MATPALKTHPETLQTLPGDDVRQLMRALRGTAHPADAGFNRRAASRAARSRGSWRRVGGTNTSGPSARTSLAHYDASGITAAFMDPEEGGFISGPKNLAPRSPRSSSPGSTRAPRRARSPGS